MEIVTIQEKKGSMLARHISWPNGRNWGYERRWIIGRRALGNRGQLGS